MARILISAFCPIMHDSIFRLGIFYEGFAKALVNSGNEVKVINTAEFTGRANNELYLSIDGKSLLKEIKNFDPELIISFNHEIPRAVLDNTECLIAVWDADSIDYFKDKIYLKKHISRYLFLCFSKDGVKNAINFGASANQTHHILAGTSIEAVDIKQNKEISFIGTRFQAPEGFYKLLKDHGAEFLKPIIKELSQDFYSNHREILRKYNAEWIESYLPAVALASLTSPQKRTSILNDLQELGLNIYGDSDWYGYARDLPFLALCYDPKPVYTLQHNQDIYNSSKICINISHAQATNGFPWRVMDIMASNGCLVSDKNTGLEEFTKGYVNIPMYESRSEAFELCKKLLKDDPWRKDITIAAQKCIDDKGRWSLRLKELSQITGLDLQLNDARPKESNFTVPMIVSDNHKSKSANIFDFLFKVLLKITPNFLWAPLYSLAYSLRIPIPYKMILYAKNHRSKKKPTLK